MKVLRSVAHRLVLTPEQCGPMAATAPPTLGIQVPKSSESPSVSRERAAEPQTATEREREREIDTNTHTHTQTDVNIYICMYTQTGT